MKQAVITLAIPMERQTAQISIPNHRQFAREINADHIIINRRKYFGSPLSAKFEKIQAFEIGMQYDKVYYFDDDTLIFNSIFPYLDDCQVGNGQFYGTVYSIDFAKKLKSNDFKRLFNEIKKLVKKECLFLSTGFFIADRIACGRIMAKYDHVKIKLSPWGGEMLWLNVVLQLAGIDIHPLMPLFHVGPGMARYYGFSSELLLKNAGIIHYAGGNVEDKVRRMLQDVKHQNILQVKTKE